MLCRTLPVPDYIGTTREYHSPLATLWRFSHMARAGPARGGPGPWSLHRRTEVLRHEGSARRLPYAFGAAAFATSAWSHFVVTDFGRVIGRPIARATTACAHTPRARDTLKSTV